MSSLELQLQCFDTLDDPSVLEEDKIQRLEELVTAYYPEHTSAQVERLILDLMWAHKEGGRSAAIKKTITKVAVEARPSFTGAPLPPDPSKLVIGNGLNVKTKMSQKKAKAAAAAKRKQEEDNKFKEGDDDDDQNESRVKESPYDSIRKILGGRDEDIERALAQNRFDIKRTITQLAASRDSDLKAAVLNNLGEHGKVVCKYFASNGQCYRADCHFSHDLSLRVCRFWLQGSCLAQGKCQFLHEIPAELAEQLRVELEARSDPDSAQATESDSVSRSVPNLNRSRTVLTRPKLVPWETKDFGINGDYCQLRSQGARHAEARNKFLALAVDNYNKNNPAIAAQLSKRGQKHNDDMNRCYHTASDLLFEQRHKAAAEIFIDLHGMELEETIDMLDEVLKLVEQEDQNFPRPVYVISSTGHYFRRTAQDQLLLRIKAYLDDWGYSWKEFKGDPAYGSIIGVDPWSHV